MKPIRFLAMMLIFTCGGWAGGALAEPTGTAVSITSIRPYMHLGYPAATTSSYWAFVSVSAKTPCDTEVYAIDLSKAAAKETYALLLAALMGGKQVKLEIANGIGCTGYGTVLQSVTILP